MHVLRYFLGSLLLMGFSVCSMNANENQPAHDNSALPVEKEVTENQESNTKEKFDPGAFIFDHIGNAHEWHITTIGHTHVTIPLPVILYSKTHGLDIFMSGKFHHGHETYKGYKLETAGANKGKIIAEDGSLPLDLSITKNVAALFLEFFLSSGFFLRWQKLINAIR